MKKYLLMGFAAVALAACGGKSNDDAVEASTPSTDAPEVRMQEAKRAYDAGDKVKAVQILEALAAEGNAEAQYSLFTVYRAGEGVEKNEEKALQFLQSSAQAGFTPALYDMAVIYLKQNQADQAAPLMQAAAQQGMPAAMYNFGIMLVRGDGVEKNEEAGKALVEQAAAQGFEPAQQAVQGK